MIRLSEKRESAAASQCARRTQEGKNLIHPLEICVDATFCFRDNYVEEGARGERTGARALVRCYARVDCARLRGSVRRRS